LLNGSKYFPHRESFRPESFRSRRSAAITAILVALMAAAMITVAGHVPTATSADETSPRRVILVADVCSRNPAFTMAELYQWLQDGLSLDLDDLILFDDRDSTPLASTTEAYARADTLISIDGVNGSAYYPREMINSLAGPGEEFDIVAHGQGGVVSLYAALDRSGQAGQAVAGKIHSILTIDSPVQGIELDRFLGSGLFDCAASNDDSIQDMFLLDGVIQPIVDRNWAATEKRYVINVANTADIAIASGASLDGLRSVLATANEPPLRKYLGGDQFNAHIVTLELISNPLAAPVKGKLVRGLIEYQLASVFVGGYSSHSAPGILQPSADPLKLSKVFLSNQDSELIVKPAQPSQIPAPLSKVFRFNHDSESIVKPAPPSQIPVPLSNVYLANVDLRWDNKPAAPSQVPAPLSNIYLANHDLESVLKPAASLQNPLPVSGFFLANEDLELVVDPLRPEPNPTPLSNIFISQQDTELYAFVASPCLPTPCTVNMGLSYFHGTVNMEFTIGTLAQATGNSWGVARSEAFYLESSLVPIIDPPETFARSVPGVPPIGIPGVLATLTTIDEGIICSEWQSIDTGTAHTAAGPLAAAAPACSLSLDLNCSAGTVDINILLGTSVPANMVLFQSAQNDLVAFANEPIPVTDPPAAFPRSVLGVFQTGKIGVPAILNTFDEGIICSSWRTIDTTDS